MAPRTAIPASTTVALIQSKTGDEVIDKVQMAIAGMGPRESIPESKLAETLAPLFTRAAFYGIREENWNYFLFTLCKTRLILEENVQYFKSSSQVRADLGKAIQLMVKLQNDVAKIYGSTFSITDHIRRNIGDRDAFTRNLPQVIADPDYKFFDARDVTIQEIRKLLKPHGLVNF